LRTFSIIVIALGLHLTTAISAQSKELALEFEHLFSGETAKIGSASEEKISLKRLDYLLSSFALQASDSGEWIESPNLAAYISLGEGEHTARLGFVPSKKFSAVRFRIGVDEATNSTDPSQFPAGHALNPQVNDLHWGWSGGFIFLALEGLHGEGEGFSFHLANDGNSPIITLPVEFDTARDCTIHVRFDVSSFFEGGTHAISFSEDGRSSHSREGDPIPGKMTATLRKAFDVSSVTHDRFQTITKSKLQGPAVGTPYPLNVTGRFPKVALPSDNPLTLEGVALGEKLFFDKRLSKGNQQSCSTCHDPGKAFSDGEIVSIGVEGTAGKRNSQALFNLAWHNGFFWDGRAKTLREQVLMPITDAHEMNADLGEVVKKLNGDEHVTEMFAAAFGTASPNEENLARALEQYLLTLVSQDSKFDRAIRKELELSPQEQRGLELFVTEHDPARGLFGADCFHCHGGHLFTSRRYTNNGLDTMFADRGRGEVTKSLADDGKFKVPSLRNIAVTAPYMHDGRFATLEEVVDHYDHGVKRSETLDPNLAKHPSAGLGLSPEDKSALIAFLKTLTDPQFQSK